MAYRFLYLIRHGNYDSTTDLQDGLEGGLTPLGEVQAERTALRLAGLPVEAIHHSTLRRAVQTAEVIARFFPGVPRLPSPLLKECIPGIPSREPEAFENIPAEDVSGGLQRAEQAFSHYFRSAGSSDQHELLVCHGNIIRYFACRVLGAPADLWANADLHNCAVSEVLIEPSGRMTLVSLNDTGHLQRELRT